MKWNEPLCILLNALSLSLSPSVCVTYPSKNRIVSLQSGANSYGSETWFVKLIDFYLLLFSLPAIAAAIATYTA